MKIQGKIIRGGYVKALEGFPFPSKKSGEVFQANMLGVIHEGAPCRA
jgi:hypothetical protein